MSTLIKLRAATAIICTIMAITANAQTKIEITAGGRSMTATLADTEAAKQFKAELEDGPVTVRMNDYGGFEKVGNLPRPLTASDRRLTTSAGDIMLYQGRSIVIFYGANTWEYTPLGRIDNAEASEIRDFLSGSSVSITFALQGTSGICALAEDSTRAPEVYTLLGKKVNLRGRKISDLPAGIYIIDGKKQQISNKL